MCDNFEKVLNCAIDICEDKYIKWKYSGSFFRPYPFTTENISEYIKEFDLKNKSLLTLGSSGDQVINAALFNCRNIHVIDICPFTKFYFNLKKAAILSLNYDEFLYFFFYKDFPKTFIDNNNVFKKELYLKLKSNLKELDNLSYLFWNELFERFNPLTIRQELFSRDVDKVSVLKTSNTYLRDNFMFEKSKITLKDLEPNFTIENIFNVELNQNFDNVWLSNLGQYLEIDELKKLVDKLLENMNDESKILICYLYQTVQGSKYCKDLASIYNLDEVYKIFNQYALELNSFIGTHGILHECESIKDSVLVYKKQ